MVEYKCNDCNKIFTRKDAYKRHLNRKTKCSIFHETQSFEYVNGVKPPQNAKFCKEIDFSEDQHQVASINEQINNKKCFYCHKEFSARWVAVKHLKTSCKVYKEMVSERAKIYEELKKRDEKWEERYDQLEESNKELKESNKELKETNEKLAAKIENLEKGLIGNVNINKNSNNTNTINNNNTINIVLVAHGNEDLSKLTANEIKKILNRGYQAPIELTRAINFNPKYPEYHNVYIPGQNNASIMVYNGKKWELKDKGEVVDDIFDTRIDYISENLDKFYESLDGSKKRALIDLIKRSGDDDDQIIKRLKNDLKFLLYNDASLPKKTRKLLDA